MSTSTVPTSQPCQYCSNHHGVRCPTVKALEYHPDGTVKRVEFMTAVDYHPLPFTQNGQSGQQTPPSPKNRLTASPLPA